MSLLNHATHILMTLYNNFTKIEPFTRCSTILYTMSDGIIHLHEAHLISLCQLNKDATNNPSYHLVICLGFSLTRALNYEIFLVYCYLEL